jgi:polysaccharide export outer membrane protein
MKSIASPFGSRRVTSRLRRFLAVFLAAAGCAAWSQQATPPATVNSSAPLNESYRIQPTDILLIDVVNERELAAKEFRVASNGEISYPYIGAIKAVNKTAVEVQEEIKRLLEADFLVSAQVIVHVRDFRKRMVSVFGQVMRGGLVEIPPERKMTVIEAISAAGGLTRMARDSDIQVSRPGQSKPTHYHIRDLKNLEKPIYVEPDDVIYVPESRL